MSFAILRHGKIKGTGKGAAISHNHRLSDDGKINIDKAKAHLNIFFDGVGAKDRIDAKMPAKHRKDAVVAVEILLTSGPEFFDAIEIDREKLAVDPKFLAWVERSIGWAKKEFGANLVDAVLHMDESSPHIHVLTVPLTKDGRLCAKEVTARAEMQRRQTQYAEAMKPFGLERGTPASETKREHIPLKGKPGSGGKAAQEVKVQAALLEKAKGSFVRQQALNVANFHKINEMTAEAKKMDAYAKNLQAELVASNEKLAVALEEKAAVIAALVESGEKSTALLKTAEGHRAAAEQLRAQAQQGAQRATERDHELVAEITALRAENEAAQASLEQLRAIDRVIVDQTRERLAQEAQEAQEAFGVKWAGAQDATASDIKHMPVVDVCGNRVVYALGREKYAIHTFESGVQVPQLAQTEKEKTGVSR